jgi:eukaryotic-like serine/threonine-protein kinase
MTLYTLFDAIASGGMGTVYYGRATAVSGLARVVAIKRMHGDLARDPVCASMFHDELRLATRVRHPNVVATLDLARQDNEVLLVMEYVQGESLQDLIARTGLTGSRIPPAIAVSIVCGVLQGLQAAHDATNEAGQPLHIVHRDVSPENVLVGRDGIARLLDFGIARSAGRKYVTRVGEIKGKPSYLAPEQILDGGQRVDRRADIYGAAVVLWEALTGIRLFDGDSLTTTLSQVLTGDVAPPSSLAGPLPHGLDDVVLRGLSRDPNARFATALEMARALAAVTGTLLSFEVGEWVLATAPDSLARQAEHVARLESVVIAPPPSAPAASRPAAVPSVAPVTPARLRPAWPIVAPRTLRGLAAAAMTTFCFTAGVLVVTAATAQSHPAAPAVAVQVAAPIVAVPSQKMPVAIAATLAAPVLSIAATPKPKRKRSPRRPVIDDGF